MIDIFMIDIDYLPTLFVTDGSAALCMSRQWFYLSERSGKTWSPPRWAQFFICPLMIRDAIDREVEAVDSGESFFFKLLLSFFFSSLPSRRPSHVFSSSFSSSSSFCLLKSTSWPSRQTPTGRRCCLAVWPSRDTPWASSAGVSW